MQLIVGGRHLSDAEMDLAIKLSLRHLDDRRVWLAQSGSTGDIKLLLSLLGR